LSRTTTITTTTARYLDGEAHVRASVAMDALAAAVCRGYGAARAALAYLASPALAYPICAEAHADAAARHAGRGWLDAWWHRPLSALTGAGVLQTFEPNARPPVLDDGGRAVPVLDGLLVLQVRHEPALSPSSPSSRLTLPYSFPLSFLYLSTCCRAPTTRWPRRCRCGARCWRARRGTW